MRRLDDGGWWDEVEWAVLLNRTSWPARSTTFTPMSSPTPARTILGDLQPINTLGVGLLREVSALRALACAVPVIRWGAQVSSDGLRRCARCTACGHKGATIQHPGWAGEHVGFMPLPVDPI
jgi:hypothetical protein